MDKQETTKADAKNVLGGVAVLALIIFIGIKAYGESGSSGSKDTSILANISGTYLANASSTNDQGGKPSIGAFRIDQANGRLYELAEHRLSTTKVVKLAGSDDEWIEGEAAVKPGAFPAAALANVTTTVVDPKPDYDYCTVSTFDTFTNPQSYRDSVGAMVVGRQLLCFSKARREMLIEGEQHFWSKSEGIEKRSSGVEHCQQNSPIREGYCLSDLLNGTPSWWWRGNKEP